MKLERSHQCTVAAIGEWSDDEPTCVAQVLVTVRDIRGDHSHNDLLIFKVVAELRDPLKVI